MVVAYITAGRAALGSIQSDPGKFYAADPYTFLFASVLMLIFGAGLFSVWRGCSTSPGSSADAVAYDQLQG